MKLWKSMLLTTVLLGSIAAPSVSHAVDGTAGDETGKKDAKSYGSVNLQAGKDDEPGEPEIPIGEPGEGEDGSGETGNTGVLALTYVSPLEFGDFQLTGKQEVLPATNENPSLQMRDIRGTAKGWTVQVSMTDFKQKGNDKVTMKGASLYLPKGTAKASGTAAAAPTTREVKEVNAKAQTVFEAQAGTGAGAWMDQFGSGENGVKLTIPQDVLVGEYQAELTWTISDTPGKK